MGQTKDPLYHRRSIRLKGYDYSEAGDYFVTIVTKDRESLFGVIVDGEMRLNEFGKIVREEWERSAHVRKEIEIEMDEFVVMPNHIHGIIAITTHETEGKENQSVERAVRAYGDGKGDRPVALTRAVGPMKKSLGAFVAGFKSSVTTRINTLRLTPGQAVWLRNYYEHIICNEKEYENIVNYIHDNPQNWGLKDEYYQ